MTRVLITGAAGFLGSHFAELCVARGDEVLGVDNFDPAYPRRLKESNLADLRAARNFRLAELDILDTDRLAALLTPDTAIVHLAARAGVRASLADPQGYVRVNVLGTQSVLDAARRSGVRRLVFASSSSVYGGDTVAPFREDAAAGGPVSPYGASKRAGELLLVSQAAYLDLRVAALRLFSVYGPRPRPDLVIQSFARRLAAGLPVTLFGDGSETRNYSYYADIIAGMQLALDWTANARPGVELFNLSGPESVPLLAMVKQLADALGVQPRIEWAPRQPGDILHTGADLSRSERILGFRPQTSFADGIGHFVAWFEETYARQ